MNTTSFHRLFGSRPEILSSAPGRINIIGEHTDYNGGYVLPAAIQLRTYVLAARRTDGRVRVWAEDFAQGAEFFLSDIKPSRRKKWENYVKGICWVLAREGYRLGGVDAIIRGDVPIEAGLSSSAALEVSLLQGLDALFGLGLGGERIARLAQKAENEFVGVKCGLMDQFVAVFGRPERALYLDCQNLTYKLVPVRLAEQGLCLLVYDTCVPRRLASSEYNRRREEASSALEVLKRRGVGSYREATPDLLEAARADLSDLQYRRARHIISENRRVKEAVRALREDDFGALGRLLFLSHESLRDDYEVSCPELDLLYATCREFPGCLGARLVGAGFGGSGIVLVKHSRVEALKRSLRRRASLRGYPKPRFFEVTIGGGAEARNA